MFIRGVPSRRWPLLALLLLLLAGSLQAQTVPILGHLAVQGHINTCITNPSGGTDTYTCALESHLAALEPKACYGFVADVANTGPASITFTGLGTRPITKADGGITTVLADNDIRAGMIVHVCWDGTNMQCQNCLGNAASGTPTTVADGDKGAITVTGGVWSLDPLDLSAVSLTGTLAQFNTAVSDANLVSEARTLTPSAPLTGGGDLSANRTLACPTCTTNAAALTASLPVIGAGGQATAVGTRSGNTTEFGTTTGTKTQNQQLAFDASGNIIASGTAIGSGGVTTDTAQRAAFYNATTTVDGAPGLTFAADGTTITSYADRITTLSTSATLGVNDGPVVACDATAGTVTATLPDGTTTTQRRFTLVKIDASANTCLIAPNATGTDTINGVAGSATLTSRWDRYDVDLLSTATAANWAGAHGIAGPLSVAQGGTGVATVTGLLAGTGTSPITGITSSTVGAVLRVTGADTFAFGQVNLAETDAITGDMPYANLTPPSAASRLLARGDTTGDWQEVTLGANCTMSGTVFNCTGGAGGGDFSSNTATSVDSEVVLFSGTGGKTGKRSTGTGLARLAAGVQSAAELSGDVTTSGTNAVTLAPKYRTHIKSAMIDAPTTADTNKVQWTFPTAITITRVVCSVGAATSVTMQLDERAEGTPNTAGTNVMTASLVCDVTSEATTTFTNATIAARVPLNLQITAVSGTPGSLRVHVEYTID